MTNPFSTAIKQKYSSVAKGLSKTDTISTITELIFFLSDELAKVNQAQPNGKTVMQMASEKRQQSRAKFSDAMKAFGDAPRLAKEKELQAQGWQERTIEKSTYWNAKKPGEFIRIKADGTTEPVKK